MCILFLNVNQSPSPGQYRLVLAANRDEYYRRPARQACFWEDHPHVLAGQDREPGREGGTWLGMSSRGKVGIILNILMGADKRDNAKGRGFLVTDYLASDTTGMDYLRKIAEHGLEYNHFNLVTLDFSKTEEPQLIYYTNGSPESAVEPHPLPLGTHAFGNSMLPHPLMKVKESKKRFEKILGENSDTQNKSELIQELVNLLKCDTKYHPDPELDKPGNNLGFDIRCLCSNFVTTPQNKYGSRTHTVILVAENWDVDFEEWTMKEPIDPKNPEWVHRVFHFKLFQQSVASENTGASC